MCLQQSERIRQACLMFRPRRQIYHFCSKSYDGSRGPLRKSCT
uniref:Uncharacterized protein n=1 Tax=Anguilla anguilla TaxID=7936 RepID=A0A0E9VDJ5_ANGAN